MKRDDMIKTNNSHIWDKIAADMLNSLHRGQDQVESHWGNMLITIRGNIVENIASHDF